MGLGKSLEGFRLLGSDVSLQEDIMTLSILPGHLHRLFDLRFIGSRPRASSCSSGPFPGPVLRGGDGLNSRGENVIIQQGYGKYWVNLIDDFRSSAPDDEMTELERLWGELKGHSSDYIDALAAVQLVSLKIEEYEAEFLVDAEETRNRIRQYDVSVEQQALAITGSLGEEDIDGRIRSARSRLREIEAATGSLLALGISEIAAGLQAKASVKAINPLLVEGSHINTLSTLQIEHESHLRSPQWGSSSWILSEEKYARAFKSLLQVIEGARWRRAGRGILWPAIALVSLTISIISTFEFAVDLTILPLPFLIIFVGLVLVYLPSLSSGVRSGLRIAPRRTATVVTLTFLVPPLISAVIQLFRGFQGTPFSIAEFLLEWVIFEIAAVYFFLAESVETYPLQLQRETTSGLMKLVESKVNLP